MRTTRSVALMATTLAVALAAAGCGSTSETEASSSSAPPPAADTAAPTEAPPTDDATESDAMDSGDATGETVTVTAVDYGFEDLPSELPAGTTLGLKNTSETELHEIAAFRLPDDETRPLDELLALPREEQEALVGMPVTVIVAEPGGEGFPVMGDGTVTEPGRYLLLCGIPQGADPQEYMAAAQQGNQDDVAGGPPHFALGMVAEVQVQ